MTLNAVLLFLLAQIGPVFPGPGTPHATGDTVTFLDSFSGSGALSGNWSVVSAATPYGGTIVQASGVAQNSASYKNVTEIVTGISFPRNQFAQNTVVTRTNGQTWLCILMDTSGNGYCAYGASIWKATAGTLANLGGSGAPAAGDAWELASDSAGHLVTYKNGAQQSTVTDTTWTSGYPGIYTVGSASVKDPQVSNFAAGVH